MDRKPKGYWTEETIRAALVPYIEMHNGRMPSLKELQAQGRNDLSCAIVRQGGYRKWAGLMGVPQKGHNTHRGQKWERHEASFFRGLGMDVEEQATLAPFDLLVNGYRVDVKTSTLKFPGKCARNGWYQFGSTKMGSDCDAFDLLCIGGDAVVARFVVPSAFIGGASSITLVPSALDGRGKYGPCLDAVHLLGHD